jgi:ABC-type transport system involved in multi-copper enzyme maturation permease subunit
MLLSDIQLPAIVAAQLEWFVAGLVILIGLLVAGVGDLSRVSWIRLWAISGVCFAESIRRRVLWITPLAIIGVVVAVQLLNPLDEQDAIRQTIKYSLFATGTLITLVTIILACTNLPKEIDNRVIFTVVTKPTTRLEIILGKIVGFARVSALLLIIMGAFTLAYAEIRATQRRNSARERVEFLSANDPQRSSLMHYASAGLLQSKQYARPVEFQQYARVPQSTDVVRWIVGGDQNALYGFDLPPEMFADAASTSETAPDNGGVVVLGKVAFDTGDHRPTTRPTPFPVSIPNASKFKGFNLKDRGQPMVNIQIMGPDRFDLVPSSELPSSGNAILSDSTGGEEQELTTVRGQSLDRLAQLNPSRRRIYIRVMGTGTIQYGLRRDSIRLFSPRMKSLGKSAYLEPVKDGSGAPAWPAFRGQEILGGQHLKGGGDIAKVATGVFAFRNVELPSHSATLPLELKVGIEGSGEEISANESVTHAVLEAVDVKTGRITPSMDFPIESNRTAFVEIPADIAASGNFDIHLRCLGPGHYLVLRGSGTGGALEAVTAEEPFILNLCKSLFVMWLLSLLVIIVAIFCSTFVSWPIAVVLTVVILLLHWGANQIAETNTSGLGAQVTKDLFSNMGPAKGKVISSAVDNLSHMLNTVSKITPDISQFSATEDIERGVMITPRILWESLKVIVAFGIPLTVLSYVFFKRKEVAP